MAAATDRNIPSVGWTVATGVMLVLAGIVALATPGLTTVAVGVTIGWLLLLVGIAGIVMGLRARHRRWSDVALGVLSVLVALLVLFDPLGGALSLTLAFAIWLAVRGIIGLVAGVTFRGAGGGLLIAIGVIDLLLAVLLFANFPFPAVQAVGLFVGVSLLLGGVTTLAAAVRLRNASAAA